MMDNLVETKSFQFAVRIVKLYKHLTETSEAACWLRLMAATDYLSRAEYESLHADCDELLRSLISITKASKQSI